MVELLDGEQISIKNINTDRIIIVKSGDITGNLTTKIIE